VLLYGQLCLAKGTLLPYAMMHAVTTMAMVGGKNWCEVAFVRRVLEKKRCEVAFGRRALGGDVHPNFPARLVIRGGQTSDRCACACSEACSAGISGVQTAKRSAAQPPMGASTRFGAGPSLANSAPSFPPTSSTTIQGCSRSSGAMVFAPVPWPRTWVPRILKDCSGSSGAMVFAPVRKP